MALVTAAEWEVTMPTDPRLDAARLKARKLVAAHYERHLHADETDAIALVKVRLTLENEIAQAIYVAATSTGALAW